MFTANRNVTDTQSIEKKVTNLRSYFVAEMRKISNSTGTGKGADDLYESQWKFFSSLEFLRETIAPRKSRNSTSVEDAYTPSSSTNPTKKKQKTSASDSIVQVMQTATTALNEMKISLCFPH